MWYLGTWLTGGLNSAGLKVVLDNLRGFSIEVILCL